MNTIYDGTYVIGQTSSTNFQAGPGISITQPSEGIVRIANDETVLFSGNNFTPGGSNNPMNATATLSESIFNFDRIRLDFSGGSFFNNSVTVLPYTGSMFYLMVKKEQANNGVYIGTMYRFSDATTLSGFCSYGDTQNVGSMTGGYWGYGGVCRVVGINRKEV